jgi:hypothetical protein
MVRGGRLAAVLAAAGLLTVLPARAASADSSVAQQQVQVVTMVHQPAISAAQNAVNAFTDSVAADRRAVAADQAAVTRATSSLGRDAAVLEAARNTLISATVARQRADGAVALDRTRLAGLALSFYTGSISQPDLATIDNFQEAQNAELGQTQLQLVAGIVDGNLHQDLHADQDDHRAESAARAQAAADQAAVADDRTIVASATSGVAGAQQSLQTDEGRLAGADATLGAAETALTTAVAALSGPATTPQGQLSLLGGAALDAGQMVAWYNYQGYVDLTSAPIAQLAAWYIQDGQEMGVRGDVAFAQAVIETGGFSSPDAVNLSNFAGIGHCDTCSAGFGFPSPAGGVLGQIQLLRIFADNAPAPAGAPGPVLPNLTTAQQFEAGCCSTVQSLTGVWATDPTYGEQIMVMYSQMLDFTLSTG